MSRHSHKQDKRGGQAVPVRRQNFKNYFNNKVYYDDKDYRNDSQVAVFEEHNSQTILYQDEDTQVMVHSKSHNTKIHQDRVLIKDHNKSFDTSRTRISSGSVVININNVVIKKH
jgi:hypothetical protein